MRARLGTTAHFCKVVVLKLTLHQVRGRLTEGHLGKGVQALMAQGRSTKSISMIKWIRTSRFPINNSPSLIDSGKLTGCVGIDFDQSFPQAVECRA